MSQRAYRQRKENYIRALEEQLQDACSERNVLSSLCTTQGDLVRRLQSRVAELERDRATVAFEPTHHLAPREVINRQHSQV